jgi:mono/diheme cytochrome c family protein
MNRVVFTIGAAAAMALTGAAGPPAAAQSDGIASRGAAYAEKNCARCHGVGPGDKFSPMPELAPFRIIANTPGMTGTAIAVWLRTPHKEMPNLMIEAGDRADLIAYIVSLRDASDTK